MYAPLSRPVRPFIRRRRWGVPLALLSLVSVCVMATPSSAAGNACYPPVATAPTCQWFNRGQIPLTATTAAGGETAKMPDGEYRTWLAISGSPRAGLPAYLAEVDPFTRTTLKTYPLPGASGAWGVSVTRDGDVYVATYGKGQAFRLAWGATEITNLGAPTPDTSFLWEGDVDPEGRFYIGTTEGFAPGTLPPGRLVGWDPATGEYRDYGSFGDKHTYVRSVEYADGQLYVGVGPTTGFFRVDPVTGQKTELTRPPGMPGDKYTYQLDDAAGMLYVLFAGGTTSSQGWVYDLRRQTWAQHGSLGNYGGATVSSADNQGRVYLVHDGELKRYHPHRGSFEATGLKGLSAAKGLERIVHPETGHEIVVAGQPNGDLFSYDATTGEGTRSRVSGLTGTPTTPRSLAIGPDGRVYAGGYFSGGLVAYDPATTKWTSYEFPHQVEGMTAYRGKLYLGIYPDAEIWEYDPAQPFGEGNPHKLFDLKAQGQERPWTLAPAGDYLAIGTSPKNSQTDGAVALYDPDTGGHRSFVGIAGPQQISALTYRDGVLYGGSLGCCPAKQDGRVFALDVTSGEKLWETVPLPGEQGVNALAFDATGRLYGVTAGTVFELDTATRKVARSNQLWAYNWEPVTNFQPRAVNLHFDATDGYLYGGMIGHSVRIDPLTLTSTGPDYRVSYAATEGGASKYYAQGNYLLEIRWR